MGEEEKSMILEEGGKIRGNGEDDRVGGKGTNRNLPRGIKSQ